MFLIQLLVSVASGISVAIYQQEVSSSISKALIINSVDIVLSFSGAIVQFVAAASCTHTWPWGKSLLVQITSEKHVLHISLSVAL